MKKILSVLIVITMLMTFTGCFCKHEWADATCTDPKRCTKCDEVEGDARGHSIGEWGEYDVDMVSATSVRVKKCEKCEYIFEKENTSINDFYEDSEFIITPADFAERLENLVNAQPEMDIEVKILESNGELFCGILSGGDKVGTLMFMADGVDWLPYSKRNEPCFRGLLASVDGSENAAVILCGIIETLDPSLNPDAAANVAVRALTNATTRNDITYMLAKMDNSDQSYYILATGEK